MKKWLLGGVSLVASGFGVAANAADMALLKAPPPPAVYSWSGCYVGGNGGGLFAHKDWYDTLSGSPISGQNPSSWLGGAQGGCNYQFSSWVFGVQGDYDWTEASASANDLVSPVLIDRSRISSLASVTGRIGAAADRYLGYVKGGAAWERDRYDTTFAATGVTFSTARENRTGFTVGFGVEYAFVDFLTGFVEYDYYDFGTRTNRFTVVATGASQFTDIKESKNVVKAGLNLKFNWLAPVRY